MTQTAPLSLLIKSLIRKPWFYSCQLQSTSFLPDSSASLGPWDRPFLWFVQPERSSGRPIMSALSPASSIHPGPSDSYGTQMNTALRV